jgi:hypothetical protein
MIFLANRKMLGVFILAGASFTNYNVRHQRANQRQS